MLTPSEMLIAFIRNTFPMPLEKAVTIAGYFNEAHLNKHDFISTEGKVCNQYHFLCSGFMRSWTIDLEGREVTTGFFPTGKVVCDLFSFFKRVQAKENIQALTPCHTLYISFNDLQTAFHSMPEFREFGRTILINAYAQLKERMLSSLHETAEQRYKNLLVAAPEIFQYASLKQIASYLGVTDTSLSRIRKEFTKEH